MSAHTLSSPFESVPWFTLKNTHEKLISCVKFSPINHSTSSSPSSLSSYLASGSGDGTVRVWNLHAIAQHITASREQSDTNVIDVSQNREQYSKVLQGHKAGINDLVWSHDVRYICTGADDARVKIWNVETTECVKTLKGHVHHVTCVSYNPASNLIASGSFDETVRIWDSRTGKCMHVLPAHSNPVTAVHFSTAGTLIVTSSYDGTIRIWDSATAQCLRTIKESDVIPVSFSTFTPNCSYVLASTLDGKVRLWNYSNSKCLKIYRGHVNSKFCIFLSVLAFDKEHVYIASGSEDGKVYLWDLQSKQIVQTLALSDVNADAKQVNGSSQPSDEQQQQLSGSVGTPVIVAVDCQPQKHLLACGSFDGDIALWMPIDNPNHLSPSAPSSPSMTTTTTMVEPMEE